MSENYCVISKQFSDRGKLDFRISEAIGSGAFAAVSKGFLIFEDGTEIEAAIKKHEKS